ncbi:MAG: hypothetical protein WCM76_08425 [Bacteroidota bacterium]
MGINISTGLPAWLAIFCVILGIGYAALLYYKERGTDFKKKLRILLFTLRALAVTIIAFLLLSPLVKIIARTTEKPLIIIAQDNSQSVVIGRDSTFMKSDYRNKLKTLTDRLAETYEVRSFTFGDKISDKPEYSFNEKQTDLSALFDDLASRYANRNVGALILATDGLYNKGASPVYAAEKFRFPVYGIALGDTSIQKDVILTKVNYNRIVYLGNDFPIEAVVTANKCGGSKSNLTVTKDGKVLFTKTIDITGENYIETVNLQLEAATPGVQHYRVSLSPVTGEISHLNNSEDIFIEVLDGRQKVLLLAGAPHPDIAALREAIESNKNYEVEVAFANDFNKPLSGYNLVILHQLPLRNAPMPASLANMAQVKVPLLYIIGNASDLLSFSNLKTGLSIVQSTQKADEAQPLISNDFALFTISEAARKVIPNFPPLSVPFGDFKTSNSVNVLFYQKIGSVSTRKPLIMFSEQPESRIGIVAGEGLWKWRLNDYLQTGNHNTFDELCGKMVQFLSVKEDKGLFRVICKHSFAENEAVELDAEVYNDSYELINEPEVSVVIQNADKKKFNFTFSKTQKSYHLEAGMFPVGEYEYSAQVKVGDKVLQKNGVFTVSALNVEAVNLVADHKLLYSLANKHDGKVVFPSDMDKLQDMLKARDDIKSVSYTRKRFNDVVNLFWVFLLILGLLSTEWFLRKRNGSY